MDKVGTSRSVVETLSLSVHVEVGPERETRCENKDLGRGVEVEVMVISRGSVVRSFLEFQKSFRERMGYKR